MNRLDSFLAGLIGVGLLAAIALPEEGFAEPSDWALRVEGENFETCVKSEEICHLFERAVRRGWIASISREKALACYPKPDCFAERSNCIVGFNCRE